MIRKRAQYTAMLASVTVVFALVTTGSAKNAMAEALPTVHGIPVSIRQVYTVQKGDTLWNIAKNSSLPVWQLKDVNPALNTISANQLPIGQTLFLPNIWVVHRGDSLFEISRMKGISIHSIEQLNGLKSTLLTPNTTLLLPARTATTQHSEIHTFATVQAGDTLWKIAHQYGVSVETLALLNGIASPRELPLGRVLMIPPKTDVYSSPSGWPVDHAKTTAVSANQPAPVASSDTITPLSPFYDMENLGGPSTVEQISFIVRDAKGNPVPNAQVRFGSGNASIVATSPLQSNYSATNSPIQTTDAQGKFTELFVPGLVSTGTAQVTAYVNGQFAQNFALTVVPASSAMQSSFELVNAQTHTWRVTIHNLDIQGQPVADVPLQLWIPSLVNQTVNTDATGTAVFTFQAPVGSQANISDPQSSVQTSMTLETPPASTMDDPKSIEFKQISIGSLHVKGNPILAEVIVKDAAGNPVSGGVPVTISTSNPQIALLGHPGMSYTSMLLQIDQGNAEFWIQPGTKSGVFFIQATLKGATLSYPVQVSS